MVTYTPPRAMTQKQKRKQQQERAKELLKIHLNESKQATPSNVGRMPSSSPVRVQPTGTRHTPALAPAPVSARITRSCDRYPGAALYPHGLYQSSTDDSCGDDDSLDEGATALMIGGESSMMTGGRPYSKPNRVRVQFATEPSNDPLVFAFRKKMGNAFSSITGKYVAKAIGVAILILDLACHYCRWADTELWRSSPKWEYLPHADKGTLVSIFHFAGSSVGLLLGLIADQALVFLITNPFAFVGVAFGALCYSRYVVT